MGYFGKNLSDILKLWVNRTLNNTVTEKYGHDAAFSCVILPSNCKHGDDLAVHASEAIIINYGIGDHHGPQGFVSNVMHKLSWCLRTGMNSSEARQHPDLIEPGDFPYEGAGCYKGYWGGVSGLNEESDWWLYCRIIDEYSQLRIEASQYARKIAADKTRPPGDQKYLLPTQ